MLYDSDALSDNFIDKMETNIISHDNDAKNIICCCKKTISHDETMKFKLKVNPELKK